jgi:hypothetical protein
VSRRLLEGDVHCGKLLRSVGIGRLIALSDFAVPGNLESAVPYSATLGGERRYGVGGGMLRHGRISQCRVTMGSVVPYAATLGGGRRSGVAGWRNSGGCCVLQCRVTLNRWYPTPPCSAGNGVQVLMAECLDFALLGKPLVGGTLCRHVRRARAIGC